MEEHLLIEAARVLRRHGGGRPYAGRAGRGGQADHRLPGVYSTYLRTHARAGRRRAGGAAGHRGRAAGVAGRSTGRPRLRPSRPKTAATRAGSGRRKASPAGCALTSSVSRAPPRTSRMSSSPIWSGMSTTWRRPRVAPSRGGRQPSRRPPVAAARRWERAAAAARAAEAAFDGFAHDSAMDAEVRRRSGGRSSDACRRRLAARVDARVTARRDDVRTVRNAGRPDGAGRTGPPAGLGRGGVGGRGGRATQNRRSGGQRDGRRRVPRPAALGSPTVGPVTMRPLLTGLGLPGLPAHCPLWSTGWARPAPRR